MATKENIKFYINPSGSVGIKVPDIGDDDYFGIEKCENGYVVKIGRNIFIADNQDEAFALRDKFRGWGLPGVNEYLKVKNEPKTTHDKVCTCSNRKPIKIRCNSCNGLVPVNNTINIKAERELPKKEVQTFVYVVDKDGTPIRLTAFNWALTIGEVNELIKQASGDRSIRWGGNPNKPFCDICEEPENLYREKE